LLVKSNWLNGALKQMAPFLGVSKVNLEKRPDGGLVKEANIFPETPVISQADWEAITTYYSNAAPAMLVVARRIEARTELFAPRALLRSPDAPCTTLLQIDQNRGQFYVGDAQTRTLKRVDRWGAVLREWPADSGPVALNRFGSNLLVTLIGRILPSDEPVGQLWQLAEGSTNAESKALIRGLRRPVHATVIDLDQDGREDLVISSFGNRLGRLSWFRSDSEGRFRETVLADTPGTVRCLPFDWNGDGFADLTVLRAQGREGADLYVNNIHGGFERRTLWDDPPSHGNAFLDLADFDHDQRPEMIVVNGDSGDFPCAAKPYQGLRIFAIDRELKAQLRFQFQMPGAYGARAADFDLDGDLDIALVSYFPDYQQGVAQSFVYLRNDGHWRFTPHVVPNLDQGRWIMLDAGDLDGDGDTDLLLGSFVRGPQTIPIPADLTRKWEAEKIAVLYLENKTRNPAP
jgi:hypothetical protein